MEKREVNDDSTDGTKESMPEGCSSERNDDWASGLRRRANLRK